MLSNEALFSEFFMITLLLAVAQMPVGGGGGVLPYMSYMCVRSQRVWFFSHFAHK